MSGCFNKKYIFTVINHLNHPMKNFILTLGLFLAFSITSTAQSLPDFSSYKLEKEDDFAKVEDIAVKAADYILSTPDEKTEERIAAFTFILQWMSGTPDYNFNIDDRVTNIGGEDIFGAYMAAALKYQVENHLDKNHFDAKKAEVGTWSLIAKYASNPDYKVKTNGKLKKLCKAYEKGELEAFLEKV